MRVRSIVFRDVMDVTIMYIPCIKLDTETGNNEKFNLFYIFIRIVSDVVTFPEKYRNEIMPS